jgi:hypothetical protein
MQLLANIAIADIVMTIREFEIARSHSFVFDDLKHTRFRS